jgi:Trehalase
MRNPLNLRNRPFDTSYVATYVEIPFAQENAFRRRAPRKGPDLPTFEAARERLPAPHWPAHQAAVDCYWQCWQIAFQNLRHATDLNGFASDFASTMFNDCLYMWDSVFITLFGRYGDRAFKFQNTLDNFYGKQHPDGGICRQFRELNGSECYSRFDPAGSGPNVLGLSEYEYFLQFGDLKRVAEVFPALVAYGLWNRRYRTWPNGSYWGTGLSSGMDNQPRIPSALTELDHAHRTWVDATVQAVLSNKIILTFAELLGRRDEVQDFADETAQLTTFINQYLWDESTGFFHDLRRDQTRLTEVKTIGAYWALLADVVPADRLQRFVAHLDVESEFKRVHRIPSLSADTPGFDGDGGLWLGGVWAPTNYMVLRGLSERGFDALAQQIAENHYFNVVESFEKTQAVWEHHAPDKRGAGRGRSNFVGWTGITPIGVLLEYLMGLRYDARRARLTWRLNRTEELGVDRYPFGASGLVDLRVQARASSSDRPQVTITANQPLEVELHWGSGSELLRVGPGA